MGLPTIIVGQSSPSARELSKRPQIVQGKVLHASAAGTLLAVLFCFFISRRRMMLRY